MKKITGNKKKFLVVSSLTVLVALLAVFVPKAIRARKRNHYTCV